MSSDADAVNSVTGPHVHARHPSRSDDDHAGATGQRPLEGAFVAPSDAGATLRAVLRILNDVFHPDSPFESPGVIDLSLSGPPVASLSELVDEVRAKIVAHAVHPRHPMALAHMVPPPATVSVVADLLIGALNQCAFVWEEAPAAAALERQVVRWLADRLGLGPSAGGLITSGGTMSNYSAALLALLRMRRGGHAVSDPCIVASDQAHLSIEKSAVMLGLDRRAVVRVATDSQTRLQPGAVMRATESCRAAGRSPFLFVCTAGTPSTGAIEPTEEMLSAAREAGAWCHVDAAHGGFVSLARNHRATVAAWASADSISWDPHKSLYSSYAAGVLLLRRASTLRALRFNGDYALKPGDEADAGACHLDGSRRLEALKLWMCIRHFGVDGYRRLAERSLTMALYMARCIQESPELGLVTQPDTNVVCFRFENPGLCEAEVDEVNLQVQANLFRSGGPLLSSTRAGGRPCLRAVLLSPMINPAHVGAVLDRVIRSGRRCSADLARRTLRSAPP